MSSDENRILARRFYDEILNQGKLEVADEILSLQYLDHGAPAPGVENFKQYLLMITSVFPDINVRVEDLIAEDDKVVVRLTVHGTQLGSFRGFPATNKKVSWTGMDMIRFADGRLVERWSERDFFGMLQGLGYVQPPK